MGDQELTGLQTVHKLGPVLDLFTVTRHTWGVTQVAEALSIPRSSAHALLSSLVDIGLLQVRGKGRYSVGWRVLELSEVLHRRADLGAAAAPVLADLVRRTGETTHLAIIDRMTVLYVDKLIGTHNIVVQGARVGARLETHCTAVGKCLLAYSERSKVEEYFQGRELRRHTSSTITGLAALLKALDEIERTGYALDRGEQVADIFCVAVPVRDDMGAVIAALSMSLPVNRFISHEGELVALAKQAAADIQRRLASSLDGPASATCETPGIIEVRVSPR